MSLSDIAKKYENSKKLRDKTTQQLRSEIERSIEDVTIAALKLQNHKVNQIHKNQQAIEAKLRKQQQLMSEFRSHQEAWINLYDQLNRALMKAGDLAHYAGYVQAQIKQLVGEGTVAAFLEEAERQDLVDMSNNVPSAQTKEISQEKEPDLSKEEKHENLLEQEILSDD